ncbi:hypothetical protein CHS0354_001931 [Potamilus streckersoni]|uniref:Voltage-gated hydrogen channel 1 n=1 Tax=Potamilus streckersoni TaxID=2493646 RepID=A0AAE0VKT8_9BIVA|nr:hypothetical protein CHS0354_001931 [Potamilus streckersoni]
MGSCAQNMKELCWQVRMRKSTKSEDSNGHLNGGGGVRKQLTARKRLKKRMSILLHTHVALIVLCTLNVLDASCVIGQIISDILIMKDELYEKELLEADSKKILFDTFPHLLNKSLNERLSLQTMLTRLKQHREDFFGPAERSATETPLNSSFTRFHSKDSDHHDDESEEKLIRHKRTAGENHDHYYLSEQALYHHYILHELTHAFHLGSMVILTLLVLETLFKIFAMGKKFLSHRIEVFDAFVVTVAWCLDVAFWEGLWAHPETEAANIMIFILPWRVVRIVNSFVLVIQGRDIVQLKIVKQQYRGSLKRASDMKLKLELYRHEISCLRNLLKKKGVSEKEIQGCQANGGRRRRSSLLPVLTRLASLGLMSVSSTTDLIKAEPPTPPPLDSSSDEDDSGFELSCSRQSSASDDLSLARTISLMSTTSSVSTIALSPRQSVASCTEENSVFMDDNFIPDNNFTKL